MPLSLSDALYDGPNRVIIDDNTPETNTLPVSGGKGVDEFVITSLANSVVIDDTSENNTIVFERDVSITSIERLADPETSSVGLYVITLSSGKTITLKNSARFTFQHFGDDTRTAAISAEDFFTAHEDGFQPLDAPLSDIIGTASGPSGAQEPLMITGVFSREVTEGTTDAIVGILNNNMGATVSVVLRDDEDTDGALKGEYGTITFAPSAVGGAWSYTLDNTNTEVNALGEGDRLSDNFIFTISGVSGSDLTVTIVIIGVNDDPESGTAIVNAGGTQGQNTTIDLSTLFIDPDNDVLALTFTATLAENEITQDENNVLSYDADTKILTIKLAEVGEYTIGVEATDGGAGSAATASFTFTVVKQQITGDNTGSVAEDNPASTATGSLTLPSSLTITLVDSNGQASNSGVEGTYGTMTFDPSSNTWTYTLDNTDAETNALKDTPGMDVFTFTATGTSFDVTITVAGANDAPVLSGTSLSGKRGTVGQAIETITDAELNSLFSDPDTGDVLALAGTLDDGSALSTIGLSYTAGTGITGDLLSSLTASTYTIKVVARDSDGTGEASPEATFTLGVVAQGISDDNVGSVTEDDGGNNSATGTLSALGQTIGLDGANNLGRANGTYGTMSFDVATGVWTYTLDNNNLETNKLAENATAEDLFTFSAGTSSYTVTITVSGANDAPVVADAIEPQSGTAGQSLDIDLANLFSDPDTGDTLTLSVAVELDGNEITFDGSRNIISDLSASKELRITLASTGTYTVTVMADDGNGGRRSSSFNLEIGADTPPVIGIPGSEDRSGAGAVTEDGTLTATGMLEVTDADSPPTLPTIELDGDGVGTYGTMTFDESSGEWTYTLDERAEALGDQQTATETFTFSAGRASFEVTITITGANDAPVVATAIEPQSGVEGQEKVIDLSTLFTDVDEGDELTFTVTLDDGAALSTIGLTYDSDEDEITGTLTGTGTYVIKIVATDKSGAMVEATFDLEILMAVPIIQRNSLTYNPDETGSITIDETVLEVTSGNESAPTLLVYTITTLPDAGMLSKSGTPLNNGDTFTQADINNGLITYELPVVSDPSTSQSNPLSFTLSDGEADGLMETLQITSRKVVGNAASAQDNTVDFSDVDVPQKIGAGEGSDDITGGQKDDQIDGGAGDDEIILSSNAEEDAGADEVLYEFGYDGVGIDGGDEIVGFKRGQDKVTFVVQDSRQFANLEEFLGSLKGVDDEDLTADDAFIATMMWGLDENGVFYFDGVLLHFKDATSFGGGRVSSPVVQITFDERLDFDDLVEILGGAEKAADNFDFTHAAFKNLDEVLPRLFGEGSIGFKVIPFSNSISVIDGPVTGAEVFFDIDDDGEVSDVEKDAQRDTSGRSLYITGDDGSVSIPKKYVGLAFVAVVGSAYDTDSGERLEGEFRSLDKGRGGIATPITDLIVTYLEEVEGQAGTPTTEQEVLDEIFGDDVIMVSDVLVMENYELPESGALGEAKKQMIIRAAIALAEIKKDETLAGGDGNAPVTKVEIASTVNTLVTTPEASSVTALKEAVDERVEEVNAVKGGKPIATPTSVDSMEDTDYEFPETLVDLIELFGFLDPSGNSSSADASAFRGVYIKLAIENGVLLLDDNTPVVESTAGLGDVSVPPITGYIYITLDKLDTLKLRPALDFNGNLELIYRVWDGEQSSSDVTLTITVTSVNDDPVATGSLIVGQNGQVGHAITAIDLDNLFSDVDANDTLTLTVTGLPSGLTYDSDENEITGTPDTEGEFTVTVVANDGNGGIVQTTFDIVVVVGPIVINEDDGPVSGTISLADPTPPVNLQGTYGALTFDAASNTWTYTLDNASAAVQALAEGQQVTETFTFTDATAGVTEDVEITVVGANDDPEVDTAIGPQRVTLDLPVTAIVLDNLFSDVDANDTLTLTVTGLPSGLTYDSDENEITGTPDTEGEFTVTVVANDGNGGTVESTFDIVVSAQAVSGDDAGAVTEDGTLTTATGYLEVMGATGTIMLEGDGVGTYGTMTFDENSGAWTYTLDNTSAAVQALAEGQQVTETFTFTATDSESLTVTITVTGANDAPMITASGEVSVEDGATVLPADILTIKDDTGDIAAYTSSSFTLAAGTGATAAIVDKFEVVQDANGRWQLALKSGQNFVLADAATFVINVSVTDAAGSTSTVVSVSFTVIPVFNVDMNGSDIVGVADEGDLSTSDDLDVSDDTLLDSTTPFTISTQGTYGTASIDDDGEWVYKLDNGNTDVRALNSGDTLTDTFVVDVNLASGRATTQTVTITIRGRTDVLGSNGIDFPVGDESTSDNQAIFGFNSLDFLTGGRGDDLLVGGYGIDYIDLSAGGTDTVVYRINSSDGDGLVKAEDGEETVREFTPGEDKLVILDVNGSPTTLAGLFDSLTKDAFRLYGGDLSSSQLDAGGRAFIQIVFQADGTPGGGSGGNVGRTLTIIFDRVTSEALNDRAVLDTLTGGTDFSTDQLSSLFGGFGRPGYDAALDDGGFISIIGPDDLPDSYFEIA